METESDYNPYSPDNITHFEREMLRISKINLSKLSSKKQEEVLEEYRIFALIDLYLNKRFVLYKNYLSHEQGVSFTSEEVFDIASPILSQKLTYNDSVIKSVNISKHDISLIAYYNNLMDKLTDKGIAINDSNYKLVFPNAKSVKYCQSEKAYIDDVIRLRRLNQLGIKEYTQKIVHNLIGEELTYNDTSSNLDELTDVIHVDRHTTRRLVCR